MRPRSALGAVVALCSIAACGHHAPAPAAGSAASAASGSGSATASAPGASPGAALAAGAQALGSDVSPHTYKVGVLIGPKLYMLRGTTRIPPAGGPSGTFTPDPSFASAPPGVLDHARDVWNRTDADSELR